MPGKLDELKKMVANLFSAATDKTTIEKSAVVSQKFDEVAQEEQALLEKNSELLKSYKDVVLHTSFKDDSHVDAAAPIANTFNDKDFIANWEATHDADGKTIK